MLEELSYVVLLGISAVVLAFQIQGIVIIVIPIPTKDEGGGAKYSMTCLLLLR